MSCMHETRCRQRRYGWTWMSCTDARFPFFILSGWTGVDVASRGRNFWLHNSINVNAVKGTLRRLSCAWLMKSVMRGGCEWEYSRDAIYIYPPIHAAIFPYAKGPQNHWPFWLKTPYCRVQVEKSNAEARLRLTIDKRETDHSTTRIRTHHRERPIHIIYNTYIYNIIYYNIISYNII